jgi:hypothetical protein
MTTHAVVLVGIVRINGLMGLVIGSLCKAGRKKGQ